MTTATKEKKEVKKESKEQSKPLNLAQKIAQANGDIGSISKNGKNKQQKWNFITEGDIKASVRRLEATYGFTILPQKVEIVNKYERKTKYGNTQYFYDILQTFEITDGTESKTCQAMGTGSDSGDKALNKAMTIAFKNFEKQLFNVSDKDDEDPDAETAPKTYGSSYQPQRKPQSNYRQQGTAPRQSAQSAAQNVERRNKELIAIAKRRTAQYGGGIEKVTDIVGWEQTGDKQAKLFLDDWRQKDKKNDNLYKFIIKNNLITYTKASA